MINISDSFLAYLNSTTRLEGQYVRIEITTKSGIKYIVSDEDLISGSLKLNRKSVSGSTFDIGEAYINELSFTIIDKVGKFSGSFDNAKVLLYFGVVNESLSLNDEILLGTFLVPVDTTVRKITSIQFTCDSYLSKFDKSIGNTITSGKLYNLIIWCCEKCKVDFAMSESDFNKLSDNTGFTFYITDDTSIKTYRDVIMYASQLVCGYATDTIDGKLTFGTYKSGNDKFNINNDTIASSQIGESDFKLEAISYSYNNETIYVGGSSDSEYVLELADNPLMSTFDKTLTKVVLNELWKHLSLINFQSFKFDYNGNPVVLCGDYLINSARNVSGFITSFTWIYHGKGTVESVSLDKRVKTESQDTKKASTTGGGGSDKGGELSIIRYTNSEDYKLGLKQVKVISSYFNMDAGVSPYISISGVVHSDLVGLLKFVVNYDNVDMSFTPKYTLHSGYTTVSFSMSFEPSDAAFTHSLGIYATFSASENSDVKSSGLCSIGAFDIEMNILGTNLQSSTPKWSGRYEINEEYSSIILSPVLNLPEFSSEINCSFE